MLKMPGCFNHSSCWKGPRWALEGHVVLQLAVVITYIFFVCKGVSLRGRLQHPMKSNDFCPDASRLVCLALQVPV